MTTELNWTVAFLEKAKATDNPAGDLVADMRREMHQGVALPCMFHSKREMEAYIHSRGGCSEAIEAVAKLWPRYQRFVVRRL